MKKVSQSNQEGPNAGTTSPAPSPAPNPSGAADFLQPVAPAGGFPGLPSDSGGAPGLPAPDPATPKEPFYFPIESPADIFEDYNLNNQINGGMSADDIIYDIWVSYGGDDRGINIVPGRVGTRIDMDKPSSDFIKNENKKTEHMRWKRLKKDLSIIDIFKNQDRLKNLVYNFIKSSLAPKKTASKKNLWYFK